MTVATRNEIALGHDAVGDLLPFNQLDAVLLKYYGHGLLTEWHPYVERMLSGLLKNKSLGRPWLTWVFPILTPAELTFLLDEFPDGADVTITALDRGANAWKHFNGRWFHPDLNDTSQAQWDVDQGCWRNVRFEAHLLVEIPEAP